MPLLTSTCAFEKDGQPCDVGHPLCCSVGGRYVHLPDHFALCGHRVAIFERDATHKPFQLLLCDRARLVEQQHQRLRRNLQCTHVRAEIVHHGAVTSDFEGHLREQHRVEV